ncbi:hypothetical protein APUTEX25_004867 [Auxenochlorella protothecoides]|uniref:Nuclear/nucleolar GTPase 2 n=2 Tax=Auxenochlorella protothecoides TaxID=3075 RepID=A0A3M7KU39_AUXPR|nr:hypothetical protein APUTEX25_004867 [Auxenochlorella protothecoides]|eukprot:RMZ53379.1 hypothetical protein APUTEX25_004867 [Auxenochlorella protothecoides]
MSRACLGLRRAWWVGWWAILAIVSLHTARDALAPSACETTYLWQAYEEILLPSNVGQQRGYRLIRYVDNPTEEAQGRLGYNGSILHTVIFVHGHLGTPEQMRSLASQTGRELVKRWRAGGGELPVRWLAPDFGREASALDHSLLVPQSQYLYDCLQYLQPRNPSPSGGVVLVGYSMGVLTAQALLSRMASDQDPLLPSIRAFLRLAEPGTRAFPALLPSPGTGRLLRGGGPGLGHVPSLAVGPGKGDGLIPDTLGLNPGSQGAGPPRVLMQDVPGVWTGGSHKSILSCNQLVCRLAGGIVDALHCADSAPWQEIMAGVDWLANATHLLSLDVNSGEEVTLHAHGNRLEWDVLAWLAARLHARAAALPALLMACTVPAAAPPLVWALIAGSCLVHRSLPPVLGLGWAACGTSEPQRLAHLAASALAPAAQLAGWGLGGNWAATPLDASSAALTLLGLRACAAGRLPLQQTALLGHLQALAMATAALSGPRAFTHAMAKGSNKAGTPKSNPKHSNDKNRANSVSKDGMRSASTVRRLAMYKTRPNRNKDGKIISHELQSKELPSTRIQPDRRWFGNTRVIGQKQLEVFREEMAAKVADPFTVLVKEKKLPLSLLSDPSTNFAGRAARNGLVATQPFADTFGKKQRRKKPKLSAESYQGLLDRAETVEGSFTSKADAVGPSDPFADIRPAAQESVFFKGQSKRIWGELYKVLDSSDVVIQVIDARDPLGTRCRFLEQHLKKNARHKHMILLLNKSPAWVTKRWLHTLSKEFPTLAFHASVTNPFGKGSLLGLLRQLSRLRSDKQYISVGLVGYPNVGKSSVINTLRSKKVCKVAPVPGETKVWQYITLTKKIFLIDCPGVVYNGTTDTESDAILKGVVRVESLEEAADHVGEVLARVKPQYLRRAYKLEAWEDAEDFLSQLARAAGKLNKGGEPDLNTVAKMVLLDWQRGRIPFFSLPPDHVDERDGVEGDAAAALAAEEEEEDDDALVVGGVTEEDAAAVPDGDPIKAAAAARALTAAAAEEIQAQRAGAIPVRHAFFSPEDGGEGGQDLSGDDSEGDASDGSEEEEEDNGEEAAAGAEGEAPAASDDDDDAEAGYGEGGLSWEAVLQSIQEPEAAKDEDELEEEPTITVPAPKKQRAGAAGPAKRRGGADAGGRKRKAAIGTPDKRKRRAG